VLNSDHSVLRVTPDGSMVTTVVDPTKVRPPVKGGEFKYTEDFAVNPAGDIFIVDRDLNRVFKIHGGVVTTFA
jgi:hypothetical protein